MLFRYKKNVRSRTGRRKKRKRFLLLVVIFLHRTLSSNLVTRAIERTKRVRWTRLASVTTFMANSRKNDRPNKLLAHAIKKSVWYGVLDGGERREQKGKSGVAPAEQGAGQRDIAVGGEFGKVDGRYYGAGVKNERDIKKITLGLFCPPSRSRSAGQPLDKSEKKEKSAEPVLYLVLIMGLTDRCDRQVDDKNYGCDNNKNINNNVTTREILGEGKLNCVKSHR